MDAAIVVVRGPTAELRASPDALASVYRLLSAEKPRARFTRAFKYGHWDGVVRLMRGRFFPSGLVPRVVAHLATMGVVADVREPDSPPPEPVAPRLLEVTLRPHQLRGADEAVARRAVLLQSPTASGKTILGAEVVRRVGGGGALWLTHRDGLAKQTRSELARLLGVPVGLAQGKSLDWQEVTVGMVPTLAARLKVDRSRGKAADPEVVARLARVQLVVADEAHHGAAETWARVVEACSGARWRVGLSGTVPPRDPLTDLRLEGLLGPTVTVTDAAELQDRGFVATPTIRLLQPPAESYPTYEWVREQVLPTWREDPRPLREMGTQLFDCAYQAGIVRNMARTGLILEHVERHYRAGEKVLLMTDRVDHSRHLAKLLAVAGCNRQWRLDGSDKGREEALARFRALDPPCLLVVTPWFREGMDLPEVDVGFLAGNVRSEISVLQAVGRMLRVRPDKSTVLIYCFLDGRDPAAKKDYLAEHTAEVLRIFRERGWALERAPRP